MPAPVPVPEQQPQAVPASGGRETLAEAMTRIEAERRRKWRDGDKVSR